MGDVISSWSFYLSGQWLEVPQSSFPMAIVFGTVGCILHVGWLSWMNPHEW